eukprot:3380396-Ditylum_brightwellii.AAC.1
MDEGGDRPAAVEFKYDICTKKTNKKFAGRLDVPGLVAHTLAFVSQYCQKGIDSKLFVGHESKTLQLPSGNFVIVH